MQSGGQLEGQRPRDAGLDEGGELGLGRVGRGGGAAGPELGTLDAVGGEHVEGALPARLPRHLDVGLRREREPVEQRGRRRRGVDVGREGDLDLGEQRGVLEVEQDVAGVRQLDEAALGGGDESDAQVVAGLGRLDELGDLLGADQQRADGGGVRAAPELAVRGDGGRHGGVTGREDGGVVDETGEQG